MGQRNAAKCKDVRIKKISGFLSIFHIAYSYKWSIFILINICFMMWGCLPFAACSYIFIGKLQNLPKSVFEIGTLETPLEVKIRIPSLQSFIKLCLVTARILFFKIKSDSALVLPPRLLPPNPFLWTSKGPTLELQVASLCTGSIFLH